MQCPETGVSKMVDGPLLRAKYMQYVMLFSVFVCHLSAH